MAHRSRWRGVINFESRTPLQLFAQVRNVWQDDGAGGNGTGPTSAAGFVQPGDQVYILPPKLLFVVQGGKNQAAHDYNPVLWISVIDTTA